MNKIEQLPLNAYFRRAFWTVVWVLLRTVERVSKAVVDNLYEFNKAAEKRIRLPPGTPVEQTEHPFPTPKGPWVIQAWHSGDDGDYSLVTPDGEKFRRKGRNGQYRELYVYPRYIQRIR